MCVCERERERKRNRDRMRERERTMALYKSSQIFIDTFTFMSNAMFPMLRSQNAYMLHVCLQIQTHIQTYKHINDCIHDLIRVLFAELIRISRTNIKYATVMTYHNINKPSFPFYWDFSS